ncbi:ABC transporter permease [Candidatus Bathyarchaeota archaeon]|nr:ABC transporter permease [Candidatus Bathyarchaeota archaeon]
MEKKDGFLIRFYAVLKYEVLWHLRKKKVLGIMILAFGLATLSLALPVVLGNMYNRPIEPDPDRITSISMFSGELWYFLLAIILGMNSISGEFESGTIIPLLTKPISRTLVFLSKMASTLLIMIGTYIFLFTYLTLGNILLYGPQNNLHLISLQLIGNILSTLVWVSIVFAIGSVTKSSQMAALGSFGIWLGLNLIVGIYALFTGDTWFLTYFPGGGQTGYLKVEGSPIPTAGPQIKTGTGSIAENLVTLALNPSAIVNFIRFEIGGGEGIKILEVYTETLSYVVSRSFIVAIVYVFLFSFIAWYALKRAQISD